MGLPVIPLSLSHISHVRISREYIILDNRRRARELIGNDRKLTCRIVIAFEIDLEIVSILEEEEFVDKHVLTGGA